MRQIEETLFVRGFAETAIPSAILARRSIPAEGDASVFTDSDEIALTTALAERSAIAEQDGAAISVTSREAETFGSEAAAIAHARSLSGPSAVLQEGNRYAVYEVELNRPWGWFSQKLALKDAREGLNGTNVTALVDNVVAIITRDDYPLRFADPGVGAEAVIDRTGASTLSPVDGALQAHGLGFQDLTDHDEITDAFEFAMRDTAYAALDASEGETRSLRAALETAGMDSALGQELLGALVELAAIDARQSEFRRSFESRDLLEEANATAFESGRHPTVVLNELLDERAVLWREQTAAFDAERAAVPARVPLAHRIDDPAEFLALGEADQVAHLQDELDAVMEDIADTRSNLDRDDLDLWNMRGLVLSTADQLGLEGEQLEAVIDQADWEDTKDILWNVGEGVVAIGLLVGGIWTGGTSTMAGLAMLGGSTAVGLHGALRLTDDFQDLGAAENTSLDPNGGLVPEGSAPHWGWVAAAWVGLGFDGAQFVRPTISALRGISAIDEAVAQGRPLSPEATEAAIAAFRRQAEELDLPPTVVDEFVERALPILTSPSSLTRMSDAAFRRDFGEITSEGVTRIIDDGDAFQVQIVLRDGSDPVAATLARNEEFEHVLQAQNPAWRTEFETLSEGALANWANRSLDERATAFIAQHRLEIDALQTRIQRLRRAAETGTAGAQAGALNALPQAEERLAAMGRTLAELRGGACPAWLATADAPRLFHTSDISEVQRIHRQTLGLDTVPEGYHLRLAGGEYSLVRNPGAIPEVAARLEQGGRWRL